jgi:hypothetical protein
MEKLVLRGIMYGAEKIPDSWFDKVPGGFYKQKERERQQHQKDEKRRSQSTKRDKSRRRRHSDEYEDRRPRYDEDPYAGERPGRATERRRRHERSRSSYDGGDDYEPEEPEPERRRARRRTHGDNDRYGYEDGFSRPNGTRPRYAPDGRPQDFSPNGNHRPSQYPDPNVNAMNKRNSAAAAAASAGTAAAIAHQTSRHASVASPPVIPIASPPAVPVAVPVSGSVPASYMPYANIYGPGGPHAQAIPQMFSPPPAAAAYDSCGFPDPYHAPQSRKRDSNLPSHSPSSSLDSGAVPPRRVRSERRPKHDQERSHGK